MKLGELAKQLGCRLSGNPDIEITGVSGIEDAAEGDITYLRDSSDLTMLSGLNASALIVTREVEVSSAGLIISDNPQYSFARALEIFYVKKFMPTGISEKAILEDNVKTGKDVSVHPGAYVSNNVELGDGVTISPGSFVGDGVTIGSNSFIHPNVTIRENVSIGQNVVIHSGTVIGSDGFGYVFNQGAHHKIPQVGTVVIEDNVEIGSNVCIDRATVGKTIVGKGSKIDNQVQIAHNVKIGENCIIVSQVGISGSVEIGDGAVLAGQVGIRDHVKIGSQSVVGSQSGVSGNIPDGKVYSGSPAIPHSKWLRAQSIYSKLPELYKRIQSIERKLLKEENPDDENS